MAGEYLRGHKTAQTVASMNEPMLPDEIEGENATALAKARDAVNAFFMIEQIEREIVDSVVSTPESPPSE